MNLLRFSTYQKSTMEIIGVTDVTTRLSSNPKGSYPRMFRQGLLQRCTDKKVKRTVVKRTNNSSSEVKHEATYGDVKETHSGS